MNDACLDGVLMPREHARIPVGDEGLLRGDGVFEVMRVYDGVPLARESHLQRIARSAQGLRLALDVEALARDIDALLADNRPRDCLVRALATRGGRRIVLIEPLPELPPALALCCVTFAPVLLLDGIKSLSYAANMLATRIARERGFDEALLVGAAGNVLELPTASFFWVRDGRVLTPPLSEHILESITRRIVMEGADVREQHASVEELQRADEAFAASSVYEVLPVARIDDRELASPGPLTAAAMRALRERIAAACAAGG